MIYATITEHCKGN